SSRSVVPPAVAAVVVTRRPARNAIRGTPADQIVRFLVRRRGSRAASARRSALPQDEVTGVYSIEDLRSPVSCPTHLGPPRASSAPADSLCPALPDLPADAHGLSASP